MLANHPYDVVNKVPMSKWDTVNGSTVYLVHTKHEFLAFFELLMSKKRVFCDTETSGFNMFVKDRIVGSSFGWGSTHFYIPCRHVDSVTGGRQPDQLEMDWLRPYYQEFFAQEDVETGWHNCLHGRTDVVLADGTKKPLYKMVLEKDPGPVLCFNEDTGKVESKLVTGWLKGKLRSNDEWLRIQTVGKGHISCTKDHKILTDRGMISAEELLLTDKIATTKQNFSPDHKAFLLGTLLGDSSLRVPLGGRSPMLTCAHVSKEFAEFKASLLGGVVKKSRNNRGFSFHKDESYSIYRIETSCDSRYLDIFNTVTVDGVKTINPAWIEAITIPSVAAWYCDDGTLDRFYPSIVAKITKEMASLMLDKLTRLGFNPRITWRSGLDNICDIRFNREDVKLIAPYIPQPMLYKIPERDRVPFLNWDILGDAFFESIEKVTPLYSKEDRKGLLCQDWRKRTREYCLQVEDNHNFFVNSGELCVSNCKFDEKFYYVDGIIVKCKRHDTRILWHLFNENAPGALKVIASGWKDDLGRWNKGIVDSSANLNEKEISAWRTDESKARKKELSKAVMAAATEMKCEPRFQGWKRNDIKKYLKEEYFKDHIYAKSAKDDIHYGYIPIQLLAPYAGVDTYLTECVFDYVMKNMEWNDKLRALYENEMELSTVIMGAEIAGVHMDREYLQKMALDYEVKIAKLYEIIQETLVPKRTIQTPEGEREETIEEHKARWINLGSTDQLSKALVEYGVDLTLRSKKTDKLLLDKKILNKAARKHEIVKSILELRNLEKVKSTYFDSILEKLQPDNILHANFNQNVSTGRMSSNSPNLTNMPRGPIVRNAFITLNDDYIYVLADYSQVEVRLTAHFSGDPILIDAYRNKQDVHCRTSGQMFGVPYEEMIAAKDSKDKNNPRIIELNDYRNIGKTMNFGLIYGVSALGLSEQIPRPAMYKNLSDEQWVYKCEDFIKSYFRTHLGVKRFINKYSRLVYEQSYIENYFGRKRDLPHARATDITGDNSLFWLEQKAKRQGVNFLVQGSAADVFKIAVVRVANILKGSKSFIISFVHDEIQMYIHKQDIHLLNPIKKAMEDFNFRVPLTVEMDYSLTSWGAKKAIKH